MTQFISDSFTGTDGTTLSTYSPSWTRSAGTGFMALIGNRVRQSGATTSIYAFTATPAPSADYDVSANIYMGSIDGAPSVGVCGRMVGADVLTFYQARITLGTGIALARFVNNAATTLATVPFSPSLGSEPKLTLRMKGDQVSVLLDDVLVIGPITDVNIAGAGYAGLRAASSSSTSVHLDNFSASTLEAASAAVLASAAWSEESESANASVAIQVSGQGAWHESAEASAVAVTTSVRLAAGWTESGETPMVAGVVGSMSAATIAWVEGSESPALSAAASVASLADVTEQSETHSVRAEIAARVAGSWAEEAESFAVEVRVDAVRTVLAAWHEQSEAFALSAFSAAQSFVRAPAGLGYTPRRHEYQSRPAQVSTDGRPPAIQENYR